MDNVLPVCGSDTGGNRTYQFKGAGGRHSALFSQQIL
jgi:hypothetical protein